MIPSRFTHKIEFFFTESQNSILGGVWLTLCRPDTLRPNAPPWNRAVPLLSVLVVSHHCTNRRICPRPRTWCGIEPSSKKKVFGRKLFGHFELLSSKSIFGHFRKSCSRCLIDSPHQAEDEGIFIFHVGPLVRKIWPLEHVEIPHVKSMGKVRACFRMAFRGERVDLWPRHGAHRFQHRKIFKMTYVRPRSSNIFGLRPFLDISKIEDHGVYSMAFEPRIIVRYFILGSDVV